MELVEKKLVLYIVLGIVFAVSYYYNSLFFFMLVFIAVEAISCFYLRGIGVKSWLETLAFFTILVSIKHGFNSAFYFFLVAYGVSMAARMRVYPMELVYMAIRAFILAFLPTVLPFRSALTITFVTVFVHQLTVLPVFVISSSKPKVIGERVLHTIITIGLFFRFGEVLLGAI